MEKVTISKEEYEKLKKNAFKIRSSESLMKLQEKQKSLDFLKDEGEDIYTLSDLKEIWKKAQ